MAAESQIRVIFTITGRGTVLLLEREFTGRIRVGDTVSNGRGRATVLGVEFVDPGGWIGVVVDIPDAREVFRPGDLLRFSNPADVPSPDTINPKN